MAKIDIEEKAKKWVKTNKKLLIEKFANPIKFPGVTNPFTIFMAGSPGAGKTEYSKSFIKDYPDQNTKIVRIDADEIKNEIPGYEGGNAYRFQGASAIGVEKLFDSVQQNGQNVIVDGTFADYKISLNDVKRALARDRKVGIVYVYQDPLIAWEYTKKREAIEKRHVSKAMFIDSYFSAKDNVNKVKSILGNKIILLLVEKDYTNKKEKYKFNVDKVDNFIQTKYNREDLERIIT